VGLSKEQLERLIARSTDIVIATDRTGNVVYYNDGASRILGYKSSEVLGDYVARLYPDLPEARRVMKAMRAPEHGGPGVVDTFQTTFLSKAGEKIPVAITGTILYDEAGLENGTIGFAKDLREILRKDQLATLGEVAIGLSHEINNPLAVILNQVDLLQGEVEALAGDRDVKGLADLIGQAKALRDKALWGVTADEADKFKAKLRKKLETYLQERPELAPPLKAEADALLKELAT